MARDSRFIFWFSEIDKNDGALVGGKGANLGEMTKAKFPVPNGYVISSYSYFKFLHENNLTTKIKHLIATINFEKSDSLNQVSQHIKKLIMQADVPEDMVHDIFTAYKRLGGVLTDPLVAIRSSATAEDLPSASFAGQQETYLNIKGEANLLIKVKAAWASLFEARAIFYRHEKKFDHFKVGLAAVVQQMVESEKSGVMFTIDPVTNDKSRIVIEAIYGLGEMIVQGKVTPDHYEVQKSDLSIKLKTMAAQNLMLKKSGMVNKEIKIMSALSKKQKISDNQIKELARLGKQLEHHYYFPQDVEWAIANNKIYIVQTRPITTTHTKTAAEPKSTKDLPIIVTGAPASPGIASGPVKILKSSKDIDKLITGDVLVAEQTNPDYVPAMKKAVAIVTERGGRTSHAAIVSRELGTPAVVGAADALKVLKNGMVITVNGLKGEVYKGGGVIPLTQQQSTKPVEKIKTATKLYVNLAEAELASRTSQLDVDGVGLLRAEFMMANIGTHPKKMLRDKKGDVFVEKLASQLEIFCSAFNPRPVVYRTTDFKTNEYRGLIGGKEFEPLEPNPMLGYRGAFRYMHDPEVFNLELEAIKMVRNKKNLKNLWVMIPFVRTVAELEAVKKLLAKADLYRSPTFKLWMMVEIPSNVILLEKFIQVGLDGVSIGSNDLTMLILGTDRDNSEVAREFNEQDDAVLWALEHVITTAKKHGVTASICGQAPSLYPTLVEKLVRWGITSISVSPDAVSEVRKTIAMYEKKILSFR